MWNRRKSMDIFEAQNKRERKQVSVCCHNRFSKLASETFLLSLSIFGFTKTKALPPNRRFPYRRLWQVDRQLKTNRPASFDSLSSLWSQSLPWGFRPALSSERHMSRLMLCAFLSVRQFRAEWYKSFKWIEYSILKDAVYCFPCRFFGKSTETNQVYKDVGFRNWKKDTTANGFKQDENSEEHRFCVAPKFSGKNLK